MTLFAGAIMHGRARRVDRLIDSILPLIRLQARLSGASIEVDLAEDLPPVGCDRTMIEQVLLNLTRNGIQAMETPDRLTTPSLALRVRRTHPKWIRFTVTDRGPGISADIQARLFTPFFTTRSDGWGSASASAVRSSRSTEAP